jgi:uncharacterized protein YggE
MKRFLVPLLIFPISVFAGGGLPDKPYIYVQGKVDFEKDPDMVTIFCNVVAHNPDVAKANQEVQAKATKVLGMCDENKIAKKDVAAQDIRSEPDYEENAKGEKNRYKILGYAVSRSINVTIRNLSIFPKLVDDLFNLGGVEVSRVESGLSTQAQVEEEAWDKALADARQRADKTLKAVGMKIDSVFAVSPEAFPEIQEKIFGSKNRVVVTGSNIPTPEDLVDPHHYRFLPVTFSQNVHVIYLISPAK